MEYNPQKKQITIESSDLLLEAAVKFFNAKNAQTITFPYKKLASFIEYLSRNNNGNIEFLFCISELVLIQIKHHYGAESEEARLSKIERDAIKLQYRGINLSHNVNTTLRYKGALFLVDKKDPSKTLTGLLRSIKEEINRLLDFSLARPTKKSHDIDTKPTTLEISDLPILIVQDTPKNTNASPTGSTQLPKSKHSVQDEMRKKYGVPRRHIAKTERGEVRLKSPTKERKYFSNEKIILLMRAATKAENATSDIGADMRSSKVLTTDSVAFSIDKLNAAILQEDRLAIAKGKLTFQDLTNSVERHNNIATTTQSMSNMGKILGNSWAGKKVGDLLTTTVTAAHAKIDGKTTEQHRTDFHIWLDRKTTTSRYIANLNQITKEKSKELGLLGFLFSPMRYSRNSGAKSLVKQLRSIQHESRNEKNGLDKSAWDQTIKKYICYATQLLNENTVAGKDADDVRKKISTKLGVLEKDNWNELTLPKKQNKFVDNLNQTIDDLMDACAALNSLQSSYRPKM